MLKQPWVLSWVIFYLIHCQARSLAHLYLARCITGVSVAAAPSIIFPCPQVQVGIGAGVPIASIYLREISTPELRGTLTILMPAAANTGNLVWRMYIKCG